MMANLWLLIRSGTAVSVMVHMTLLIAVLVFAGVRPFNPVTAETIAVDIVSAEKAEEIREKTPPEPPALPDTLKLSDKEPPSQLQAPSPPPPPTPQTAQEAKLTPDANTKPDTQQASLQPPAEPPPRQQQVTAVRPVPSPQPPSAPAAAIIKRPEPDISVKYQVNLGLPDGKFDFDAQASDAAKIPSGDIEKFREHLKTCSTLPGSITSTDKIKIVLRATFMPDGRLAAEPFLIEASASAKGPALMKAAIGALEACQPYAALPADKYDEWRQLDLSFTPQDFRGG